MALGSMASCAAGPGKGATLKLGSFASIAATCKTVHPMEELMYSENASVFVGSSAALAGVRMKHHLQLNGWRQKGELLRQTDRIAHADSVILRSLWQLVAAGQLRDHVHLQHIAENHAAMNVYIVR